MHSEDYCSWVCLSVCLLVPKLASRMFIRATNDTAYLTGDADQMICGNFAINTSFPKLWRYLLTYGILQQYCRGLHNFSTTFNFLFLQNELFLHVDEPYSFRSLQSCETTCTFM